MAEERRCRVRAAKGTGAMGRYWHAAEVGVPGVSGLGDREDCRPMEMHFATAWVAGYGPAASAYDHGAGELTHLALGAACDHAVLANSTFAWWGAWIGDQRANGARRVVLAPQDYPNRFGPDILRPSWISITSS